MNTTPVGTPRAPAAGPVRIAALMLCAALVPPLSLARSLAPAQPAGSPAAERSDGPTRSESTGAASAATQPSPPPSPAAAASRAAATTGTARPTAEDPVLEARLIAVTRELRCLVCQNESIADSHAPLAVDMRNQIRDQLRSGMSEREVIAFMVDRYGNFVRFRPPLSASTFALWFGPLILLILGLAVLARQLRRRQRELPSVQPLQPDEAARLAALAADDPRERAR